MALIVPFFAETASATIEIDGVTYRVPLIDSDGHLQVDVLTSALPSGAATSAKQDTIITALQLIDDLRGALDAVQSDRLNVNVHRDGASEVKSKRLVTSDPSTTRVTVATPASGKKIRIISCHTTHGSTTGSHNEVYFGTGANIGSNAGKEIIGAIVDALDFPAFGLVWPDGAGPVGAVDDVVSFRTQFNVTTNSFVIILYREE